MQREIAGRERNRVAIEADLANFILMEGRITQDHLLPAIPSRSIMYN